MASLIGLFIGLTIGIWILSLILTFLWKKITKQESNRNIIVGSTIIAGLIYLLLGRWGSELSIVFVLIAIAIAIIIWGRTRK